MRRILCCFFLLLISPLASGQIAKDSLRSQLKLALSYIANSPDTAYQLAKECMQAGVYHEDFSAQITAGRIIGQIFINQGQLEAADSILNQVLLLGEQTGSHLPAAHAKINYGNLQLKTGSYVRALNAYHEAKGKFESYQDIGGIIKATTNIGICHMYFANYEAASLELHQALAIAQENGYSRYEGLIKNNLGRLQIKVKNYDRALEYFYQSIDILEKDDNHVSIARGQTQVGKVLNLKNASEEALAVVLEAEALSYSLEDHQGIVEARIVLGQIYQKLANNQQAALYYNKALTYAKTHKLKEQLNQAQIELSRLYISEQAYDKAYAITNEAIQLAAALRNDENYYKASKEKEALFIATDQLDSAIVILKEMEEYIKNLEGNYDRIRLLESENDLGKIKAQLSDMEISELRQSQTIAWLAALVIFITLIGIITFIINRSRQKNTLLRYEKNEEILRSKNLEIRKNKEIESIKAEIKGQELERRRLAKELHDGLGGTLSSIKLNLTYLQNNQEKTQELNPVIQKLDLACKEVRSISHHLMPPAFRNHQFAEAIDHFLNDLQHTTQLDISYEIFPRQDIEAIDPTLKNDLYRIIQEVLNNTIKHADARSVDLQLILHDDFLSLIVEDDGKGFDVEKHPPGIGLKNIRARLELHQGQMSIDSHSNRGTSTDIYIPMKNE